MVKGFLRFPYSIIVPLLILTACGLVAPTATPIPLPPTATQVPPTVSPTPTEAPPAASTQTLLPTVEPASLVITPGTLGQLRLRWNVNFPGDYDRDISCYPGEQECHFWTNITSYAFSRDGNALAAAVCLGTRIEDKSKPGQDYRGCTGESAIILYDSSTGQERGRLAPAVMPLSLAFHPQGTILAAGLANSDIELWDLSSSARTGVLTGSPKYFGTSYLAFSPDGNLLVSGGGRQLQVWDWRSSVHLKTIDQVYGIGFSLDSRRLVTLHSIDDPTVDVIRVYDLPQADTFSVIPLAGQSQPTEFSFNPRNGGLSSVEIGENSYLANFWNPESTSIAAVFDYKRDWERLGVLYYLAGGGFTPDGYFLLTRTGQLTAPESQPAATGLSAPLYACGFALADIESDQTFFSLPMLYDECTGPGYMYDMGNGGYSQRLLSPDGRFIAADDGFGNLRLWGIDSSLPAISPECSGECPTP